MGEREMRGGNKEGGKERREGEGEGFSSLL
jgi:hypothetical protein